jgi:hypothetical protein
MFDSQSFCTNKKPQPNYYSVQTNAAGKLLLVITATPITDSNIVFQGSFDDCLVYLEDECSIEDSLAAIENCITL